MARPADEEEEEEEKRANRFDGAATGGLLRARLMLGLSLSLIFGTGRGTSVVGSTGGGG